MDTATKPFNAQLAQIAWVVRDIKVAEAFFKEVMGIKEFGKAENMRAQDSNATYYGEPGDFVSHAYSAYSGGSFIELIQPVSGRSIFQDYLDKHPEGGIQHIAYSLPIAGLQGAVAGLTAKGYPIISTFDTQIAKIVFWIIDTRTLTGICASIAGICGSSGKLSRDMPAIFVRDRPQTRLAHWFSCSFTSTSASGSNRT